MISCGLLDRIGDAAVGCRNLASYEGTAGCVNEHISRRAMCSRHAERARREPQWCYQCHEAGDSNVRVQVLSIVAL